MNKFYKYLLTAFLCLSFSSLFANHQSYARGNASILAVAKSQIGVREYRGRGSNPRITRYFRKAVGRSYSDSMPWCSAFINYVTKTAGHRGTNSLSARSWVRWGRRTSSPRPGDIVVFSRRRGGHVGVFLGFSGNRVRVIGGNQSNSVSVKTYPRHRVISYRTSGRGSARGSKRYISAKAKRRKSKRYRMAQGRSTRAKRNRLKKAKRALARRVAANQRRKKRTKRSKAAQRKRVANLRRKNITRKKRYKKKKKYYQQPQYSQPTYVSQPAPAMRYSIDGTVS